MTIEKIKIKNFKVFKNVSFTLNKEINIFTGVNNSGKTTVLEAIALWNECFNKLIKQSLRKDTKLNLLKGDYRLGDKTQNYFNFEDIVSIRSPYYDDIFYNLDNSEPIEIEMTLNNNQNSINICFEISSARGSNYNIKLLDKEDFDYPKFNNFFEIFPNPLNTIFASPIANLILNEEFVTDPILNEKISRRESIKVLRNRLYNLNDDIFLEFEKALSLILGNDVKLNKNGDKKKDIAKNLSLVGSGTIQIIEILLSIFTQKKELNIILLDEPDSHIHRDIQKKLIQVLSKNTKNTQIFITTHNESFIRSAKPDYVFHLEGDAIKDYMSIVFKTPAKIKIGLQPSKQLKVLQSLGYESSLDFINALESDRLFLIEGQTESTYLDIIIEKFTTLLYKYLDSLDIQCDRDDINTLLKNEIDSLIDNKKENLPNRNIFSSDNDRTLSEIKEFHRSKLNNKDLSTLATKDDIETIISNIIKKYNSIDSYNYFEKLLAFVELDTYFDEWNLMIEKFEI